MDSRVFEEFRKLIYSSSGIALNEKKESLVAARIGKRMRALNIENHRDYLKFVKNDEAGEEIIQLLDVISTNVTSFFREPTHFDFVAEIFSKWYNGGARKFRFWSAASSTGEEPYTLAMVLSNVLEGRKADIRILGTDISTRVLEICRKATYKAEKMATVPVLLKDRYTEHQTINRSAFYTIKDEIKQMVSFGRINLSQPPFPMQGPFDIVFCRNVMIYFDNQVRKKLLDEIYRLLKPDGYLIVGHAESLTGMISGFHSVKPSIYTKKT